MAINGVELFAGGGGLLLWSALAGVKHAAAVEWNKSACATIRENQKNDYPLLRGIQLCERDVRETRWSEVLEGVTTDLLTAGPPCQPFSLGGVARSADDPRDMFPITAQVYPAASATRICYRERQRAHKTVLFRLLRLYSFAFATPRIDITRGRIVERLLRSTPKRAYVS